MQLLTNFSNVVLLLSAVSILILGIVVLLRGAKGIATISFFGFTTSLSGWIISNFFIDQIRIYQFSLFFTKLTAFFVLYAMLSLLYFTTNFPDYIRKRRIFNSVAFFISIIFSVIAFFSNGIVLSVDVHVFPVTVTHGSVYPIYVLFFATVLLTSFFNIFVQYRQAKGIKRKQLVYFLFALIGTLPIAILTNLILPSLGESGLTRIGPSCMVIFVVIMAITIIKHRFLDIRFIIGNIFYILVLVLYVNFAFFSTLLLELRVSPSLFSTRAYIIDGVISILFTIVFLYINSKLSLLNKIYTGVEKQNRVIEDIREITINNLDLEQTLNKIVTYFKQIITVDDIYVSTNFGEEDYIFCSDQRFRILLNEKKNELNEMFTPGNDLYITLEQREVNNLEFPYKNFEEDKIVLAVNIRIYEGSSVLFFLQCNDFENKTFNVEEISFLNQVFKEVSLFVNRASLHQKVLDFNKNLQRRVEDATNELKEKNDELQKAYDEANDMARKERDMLDIMGHELRTPATVVKMAAYLLDNDVKDDDGKKQIFRIKDSIERQIKLINTFINTAKLENNKIELSLEPVHLDELTKSSVEDHVNEAMEKGLQVEYIDNASVPIVIADKTRIREVIDNFISNAIKYTFQGYIKASCYAENNEVVVKIEDTGEGIKEEDRKELFQKFKRLNNYTQTSDSTNIQMIRPGGTGLGLYVSKGIIEMHKGRVWVESEFAKGSTFYFSIPIPSQDELNKYNTLNSKSANLFDRYKLTKEQQS